jgi:GLPGLI family protein
MKKTTILFIMMLAVNSTYAQLQLKAPDVKWEQSYSFDKCNSFKIEFYAKNNELMRTGQYKTYYQSDGENFVVKLVTDRKGNGMETVLDKKNEVAIQIFGSGGGAIPVYNAGGYKYPAEQELKKLEIVQTNETRQILGFTCKKYTYTYKKIFGEVWITDQISLPNDVGVFRACKMAALHNTLSVNGFVMEMTTEDNRGGKTLMKTVSLTDAEKYTVDLKGVEMNTAINKVNYFTF